MGDPTPANPDAPADVPAPTSSGVEAAPMEGANVDAVPPRLDKAWFPAETARCGDTLEVKARLTNEGCDGCVDFLYKDARSGADADEKSEAANGAAEVKQERVARKLQDIWDDAADVALVCELLDKDSKSVNKVEGEKKLRIVRPADNASPSNIPSKRSTPKWTQDATTKVWTKSDQEYSWPANYAMEFKAGVLSIIGKIKLVPVGALVITDEMKRAWKAQIETYWNNAFAAHRVGCGRGDECACAFGCCRYEVKVVCDFVESGELTTVNVNPGAAAGPWGSASWWYSGTWWAEWSSLVPKSVRAHEFGHNLGLYDEYKAGALSPSLDPNTFTEPTESIMNSGEKPQENHFRGWLNMAGVMNTDAYKPVAKRAT